MAITIKIPGRKTLFLEYLVLDFNGTLAVDGRLKTVVKPLLIKLSEKLKIHIVTADTFGTVTEMMENIPVTVTILKNEQQDINKAKFITNLNSDKVVAIGNGLNDRLMLKKASLGIAVILEEGAATSTLLSADLICRNIEDALMLLLKPLRLVAGLR